MAAATATMVDRWSRWVNLWTALSLPGLWVAVLDWGPSAVLVGGATLAVPLAVGLFLLGRGRAKWEGRAIGRMSALWIGRISVCAVTVLLALAVIAAVVVSPALLLLAVVVGSTPPAIAFWRRGPRHPAAAGSHLAVDRPPDPEPPTPPQPATADAAKAMTDAELCRAWRRSFWTLHDTQDPAQKLNLVEQRRWFLDEFEVRNPAALQAWLASGARACGGPERFFVNCRGAEQRASRSDLHYPGP